MVVKVYNGYVHLKIPDRLVGRSLLTHAKGPLAHAPYSLI